MHWVLPSSPCVPARVSGLSNEAGIFAQFYHGDSALLLVPTGLPLCCPFFLPSLWFLPLMPCPHVKALTCIHVVLLCPELLLTILLDPCLMFIYPLGSF